MLTRERTTEFAPEERVLPPRGGTVQRFARLAVWVAVTDVLALIAAMGMAYWVRYGLKAPGFKPDLVVLLAPLIFVPIYAALRLYSLSRLSPAEEFRRIPAGVSLGISALVVLGFWSKATYSRLWIGMVWGFALLLTFIARKCWHVYMGRAKARGALSFRTLVVGSNQEARRVAQAMKTPALGFEPVGFVTLKSDYVRLDGLPVYDSCSIEDAIRDCHADCVFVAASDVTSEQMATITKAARVAGVEIRVSANLAEILSSRLTVQTIGNLLALSLRPVNLTGRQALLKRTFDVVVSSLALVITLPLWLVIAIALKLETHGPVLYRQERIGAKGRPFQILKFRTMVVGADRMLDELQHRNEATGPMFKLRDDPRVTRVGRYLRRFSLDELPQLVNVLKGEMSLVGPRPALPSEVAAYEDWHLDRLEVPPGITGLWQIRGRSQLPFDAYVRLDLFYIENWSMAYDLYILAETLPAVFTRKGAY
ncbi:MAG TPA: sugar transferase [Actinomycetota bacterium]|jgi:exopolysaccharide biosynthesis polyprenyl glycosylphosphotransferase